MITVQDPGWPRYLRAVGISGLIGCVVGVAIVVTPLINSPENGPGLGIWVPIVIGACAAVGSLVGLAVYRPYRYTVEGDYLSRVRYALEMTPVRQITAIAWASGGALPGVRITSTSLNCTVTVRQQTQPLLLALGESLTRTNRADATVRDDNARRALGLPETVAVQPDPAADRPVTPPGWYRHPTGPLMWWDGTRWVEPSGGQRPDPTWSIFSHLSWFVLPILCPLVVRVLRGRRDPFSRHHSSEALNAQLTFVILLLALVGSVLLTASISPGSAVGWLVLVVTVIGAVATVAWSVFSVVGAVQASRGNWWRHPTAIRLVPGASKSPPGGPSAAAVSPEAPAPAARDLGALLPPAPSATSRPASSSKRTVVALLGVLLVLAIVGSVVWSMTIGTLSVVAPEVKVGDCLKDLPKTASEVQTVGCQRQHAVEVVAVLTMPDGDFPGQPAMDAYAEDKCVAALAAYSPQSMYDDSVQLSGHYPTAESWSQGDRRLTCIATLNPPRTASIKG